MSIKNNIAIGPFYYQQFSFEKLPKKNIQEILLFYLDEWTPMVTKEISFSHPSNLPCSHKQLDGCETLIRVSPKDRNHLLEDY